MPDFLFRPAEDTDWPLAWQIQKAGFAELVTRTAGGWSPDARAKCRAEWVVENTRMVLVHGECVGWARTEVHADHHWLDLVVLHPDHHGGGLGSAVMRALMAEAQADGVPLWLSVYRVNAARGLYRRLGFRELERDPVRVFMVHPGDCTMPPPRGPRC